MSARTRLFAALAVCAAAFATGTTRADGGVSVTGSRVELGELCPTVPEAMRAAEGHGADAYRRHQGGAETIAAAVLLSAARALQRFGGYQRRRELHLCR